MSFATNFWLIVSATAFTLGSLHLRMCLQRRDRSMHLLFVTAAWGLAVYALLERAMMLAATPEEYGRLLRWAQVCVWAVMIALAFFVREYLGTGRAWLLWSVVVTRTIALILNFTTGTNLNFLEINSIKQVTFWGELVSTPKGVPNPLMVIGQAGFLLSIVYFIDALLGLWRKGDRRRALTIGTAVAVFSVTSLAVSILVFWGQVDWPLFASPFFLGIVVAMGYELTRDIHRTSELAHDLTKSRAELDDNRVLLNLSAAAARVGIWSRAISEQTISASEKWCELFEFDPSEQITFRDFLNRIHPDDRRLIEDAISKAQQGDAEYETDYRILLRNGDLRWIHSRGRVEFADGKPVRLHGASVDITKRKIAEEEAHDMSRKLMEAQEKERARLARELHDDLSQTLAYLSIQLDVLGDDSSAPEPIITKVRDLSTQLGRLSSDVHRIAHELHPSKLNQLGLESAMRGYCRDVAETHGFKVDFDAENVPRSLPDDISLCIYRITQESMQNIAKHSGASNVSVRLALVDGEVQLEVSDNGIGFDTESPNIRQSLGLISMDERIRAVHGNLTIQSVIGAGTQVSASIRMSESTSARV